MRRFLMRPQHMQPVDIPITLRSQVQTVLDQAQMFANNLQPEVDREASWRERISLPPGTGYAALRVSVNYFTGEHAMSRRQRRTQRTGSFQP